MAEDSTKHTLVEILPGYVYIAQAKGRVTANSFLLFNFVPIGHLLIDAKDS